MFLRSGGLVGDRLQGTFSSDFLGIFYSFLGIFKCSFEILGFSLDVLVFFYYCFRMFRLLSLFFKILFRGSKLFGGG